MHAADGRQRGTVDLARTQIDGSPFLDEYDTRNKQLAHHVSVEACSGDTSTVVHL